MAAGREEGAQTRRAVEVAADVLVGREYQTGDPDQPVGPGRGNCRRATQLSPVVGEALDVRNLVRCMRVEEPFESRHPRLSVGRRRDDDGHERRNRLVDRGAGRA